MKARRTWRISAGLVLAACLITGCGETDQPRAPAWTVAQAESITSVRGHPVWVRYCHGRGPSERSDTGKRYRRFECLAGTRTASQHYATVGIFYVLHPLERYEGSSSRHRLANVRFIGGPGIP